MSNHFMPYHTAVPPPTGRTAHFPRRASVRGARSATVFVGMLILASLTTVSALTVIAAAPAGIAAPTAMLLIGGLIAGILMMRSRSADEPDAHASMPEGHSADEGGSMREQRVRSARQDRAMLLRGGWGESWRTRR